MIGLTMPFARMSQGIFLPSVNVGSKEGGETVSAFLQDMRARGFGDLLLVGSDGYSGTAMET